METILVIPRIKLSRYGEWCITIIHHRLIKLHASPVYIAASKVYQWHTATPRKHFLTPFYQDFWISFLHDFPSVTVPTMHQSIDSFQSFRDRKRYWLLTFKIVMTWSRQDKGQNRKYNINSYYFASLAYMTIVQDMEIVLRYFGYDFINETKMGTKRHQDEVKS